mmetsp:Transcript_17286/g.53667  ORF Transcript_17286/g.53667 Transcript_17286/m.53667 type:complete len:228 (-) Transcript_17286:192-875(-)
MTRPPWLRDRGSVGNDCTRSLRSQGQRGGVHGHGRPCRDVRRAADVTAHVFRQRRPTWWLRVFRPPLCSELIHAVTECDRPIKHRPAVATEMLHDAHVPHQQRTEAVVHAVAIGADGFGERDRAALGAGHGIQRSDFSNVHYRRAERREDGTHSGVRGREVHLRGERLTVFLGQQTHSGGGERCGTMRLEVRSLRPRMRTRVRWRRGRRCSCTSGPAKQCGWASPRP